MSFIFAPQRQPLPEQKVANVSFEDYTTNEVGRAVPIIWGNHKLSGFYLTGTFNKVAVAITRSFQSGKDSSSTVVTGYNYYMSFAILFCMGVVSKLSTIYANDKVIWQGTLTPATADANGMTTISTSLGVVEFYWGTSTQNPNSTLAKLKINNGLTTEFAEKIAYRHKCYAVFKGFYTGESSAPPNIAMVVSRYTSGLTLSAHDIDEDAVVPEVFYDLLTNTVYGCGVSSAQLDLPAFESASETLIEKNLGVSPKLDQPTELRQFAADLLSYINGALSYKDGKISFGLLNQSVDLGSVPSYSESDFLEAPQIDVNGIPDTWNQTRVKFTDRTRLFKENFVPYDDPLNYLLTGKLTFKEFDRQWVTKYSAANRLATEIGKNAGLRTVTGNLKLKSTAVVPVPGQAIKINYAARNLTNFLVRVKNVVLREPAQGAIEVEVIQYASDLMLGLNDVDDPTTPEVETSVFDLDPQNATVRLGLLTPELRGSARDGVLVCAARPNSLVNEGKIYANWSLDREWIEGPSVTEFAIAAVLNRWRFYNENILLDFTVSAAHEDDLMETFLSAGAELYVVAQQMKKNPDTTTNYYYELYPVWSLIIAGGVFQKVGIHRWELEVESGQLGSALLAQANAKSSTFGVWPSVQIFIGKFGAFQILKSDALKIERAGGNSRVPADPQQKRYIRVQTVTPFDTENFDDAATVYFDRNDTRTPPGATTGIFSPDWGPYSPNKNYYAFTRFYYTNPYTIAGQWVPDIYLRLGEASGTRINDGTGTGVGTNTGPTYGTTGALTYDLDLAATTDGVNDLISVPTNANLQGTQLVIEIWFKTTNAGAGRRQLISKRGQFAIVAVDNVLGFMDGVSSTTISSGINIADGVWHYVMLYQISAGTSRLYLDGVEVANGTITNSTTANLVRIGCGINATPANIEFFAADVDEALVSYPSGTPTLAQAVEHYTIRYRLGLGNWGSTVTALDYQNQVTASSPVAYLKLEETDETIPIAEDSTVNNLDANHVNFPILKSPSLILTNEASYSYTLDGASWLSFGNPVALRLSTGTLECWFKGAAPGSLLRALLVKYEAYGLYLSDGKPAFVQWGTSVVVPSTPVSSEFLDQLAYHKLYGRVYESSTLVNDGQPHHTVVTVAPGANNLKIYVDGLLSGTFTSSGVLNQLSDLQVGASLRSGVPVREKINGAVDEIAFYNSALTATAIADHYKAAVGYW